MSKLTRPFLLSVLLILVASACGPTLAPPGGSTPEPTLPPQAVTRPTLDEKGLPTVPPGEVGQRLAEGNSAFAFDLYQVLRSQDGNLFYSPHSISTALAMVYAGARGNTERQMSDTLHYTLPQSQLHAAFHDLDRQLAAAGLPETGTEEAGFQLDVANSLWGQESYPFLPEFVDLIAEQYGAELQLLDFADESNREQARQTINDWVLEHTQGKIRDLLAKGVLTSDTRLVLANAIYFMAKWEDPFLDGTWDDAFYLLSGEEVVVPMMSRRVMTPYAEGADYQAVELLYQGGRMGMLVLLPAEGQFEAFERSLDDSRFRIILETLRSDDVQAYMPKFQYEAELGLGETLAGMGMEDAFLPGYADFSGLDGTDLLYISHVVHKAFVAVDELGTEAAAATGVVVALESMPRLIKLDRPFIFVIHDRETGTVLFIGRLLDPTE